MHLKTRNLLVLLLTSSTALASVVPPPRSAVDLKTSTSAGTVDAPVDGLDGKPHTGPGLYPEHSDKKGTGEVGVSGGGSSVDIKKPPPHTGDHEIVDIEDPAEGDESSLSLKKGAGTASDDDDDDLGSSSPVSSSGHKEYQSQTDTLADPPAAAQPHLSPQDDDDGAAGGISQPLHSFTLSFVMIIFSEIGDKTFLIAALMAMKHPRLLVFSAALSSLIVMSILSALLGHAVPTLLPKNFTNFLAAGLFLVFGVRMVMEGLKMEKGTGNVQEEMKETFVMTFLGEWGDRSQIATIAMAAGQDYWYVTIGAISGHAICTGIAVVGGRMLASRISVRNVTLGGAAAFLAFGVIYLGEALFYGSS
ncbi:hypothetical protein DFP73DRAFT_572811 [Morchella snyderi]|nr:hypothetical protein DFP73DRAFT_572811 [Morchella snyderi]